MSDKIVILYREITVINVTVPDLENRYHSESTLQFNYFLGLGD